MLLIKFLGPDSKVRNVDFALLFLRVSVGLLMLTHGYPKFLRLLSGNTTFADPLGMGAEASLSLAVFAEFFCSLLLILGLVTRFAIFPILITMLVAVFVVHADDPFSRQELGLMYLIPLIFLLITGPGKYSLDSKMKI